MNCANFSPQISFNVMYLKNIKYMVPDGAMVSVFVIRCMRIQI